MTDALYRQIPKMDVLLADARLSRIARPIAVATARQVLDEVREQIRTEHLTAIPDLPGLVIRRSRALTHGRLQHVINATGVILHTNLGRAPWHPEAVISASRVAGTYTNLEMRLEDGARGGRMDGVRALLHHLVGAEDALVVNNGAAAVLLALTALAKDRDVLVSRGELVEIGGSFRVPEVISAGGAHLAEVGSTNRTRASDYADAITASTAVVLRVHRSNFRMVGFTEDTPLEELAKIAHQADIPLVVDQGSGSLDGDAHTPGVRATLASGADLVLFSGDKLLGGPQAGLVVGGRDVVDRLAKHPMYRALRVDKTILAAVEATLVVIANGRQTPVAQMISASAEMLAQRAARLVQGIGPFDPVVEDVEDEVGGGAQPAAPLPGKAVVVRCAHPTDVARRLREGAPPIVARIREGAIEFHVRTIRDNEIGQVALQLATALREE